MRSELRHLGCGANAVSFVPDPIVWSRICRTRTLSLQSLEAKVKSHQSQKKKAKAKAQAIASNLDENMRVLGFMKQADEVVTAMSTESVRQVMDRMLHHKISSVVVKDESEPLGIITKSDLMKAYYDRIDIDDPCSKIMTSANKLETCKMTDDKDKVASILESTHHHHVLVLDNNSKFVGLVSSWDISTEDARDSRVWPYLRGDNGEIDVKIATGAGDPRAPPPGAPFDPDKPTTIENHQHDFKTYMDDLDLMGFQ